MTLLEWIAGWFQKEEPPEEIKREVIVPIIDVDVTPLTKQYVKPITSVVTFEEPSPILSDILGFETVDPNDDIVYDTSNENILTGDVMITDKDKARQTFIEDVILEAIDKKEDFHKEFTPFELCREIVAKLHEAYTPSLSAKYLVIANLEFVAILKEYLETIGLGVDNIWFASPSKLKRDTAVAALGVDKNHTLVYNYDSLVEDFKRMPQFDNVAGNPPFQDTARDNSTERGKNANLWSQFLVQGMDHLIKDGGNLAFITPASWISGGKKLLQNYFAKYNTVYINLNDCAKWFDVGFSFSYYIIQRSPNIGKTELYSDLDTPGTFKSDIIDLRGIEFFPLRFNSIISSIFQKTIYATGPKFAIFKDSTYMGTPAVRKKECLSTEKSSEYPYELFHTPKVRLWSKTKPKKYGVEKVIINTTSYYEDLFISTISTTYAAAVYLPELGETAESAFNVLSKKLYVFINNLCRWNNWNNVKIMRMFPKVDLTRSWSDEELYEHFNLTEEEIKLIEGSVGS